MEKVRKLWGVVRRGLFVVLGIGESGSLGLHGWIMEWMELGVGGDAYTAVILAYMRHGVGLGGMVI